MAPVKKRVKTDAGKKEDMPVAGHTVMIQDAFAEILQDVDNFRGGKEVVSRLKANMLKLKSAQRHLFDRLGQQKAELDHFSEIREKKLRDEAARKYEQAFLKTEIRRCQSYKMSNLQDLAIDEVLDVTLDEALLQYLNNGNVRNPKEKTTILASLHRQLEARGLLESQLKRKEQELNQLTREIRLKRDFLNSLPGLLKAIDRASQPLMKFMSKSCNGDVMNQRMIGKERLLRLETALSLPPPLYTLFTLLQHYIDRIENNASADQSGDPMASNSSKATIKVLAADKKADGYHPPCQHFVTLQIPVPDYTSTTSPVGSATSKRVSIQFRYYPTIPVVTAYATGCGTTLNQDMLLEEVFPGDTSEAARQLLKRVLILDSDEFGSLPSSLVGISYQWCNVLAGFYQIPSMDENASEVKQSILVRSTRVVVNELIRRVRANAILKYCIQSMKRNVIPIQPNEGSPEGFFGWKVTSFIQLENSEDASFQHVSKYQVAFQNDSDELRATVSINAARYPIVPPRWKIHTKQKEQDDNDLFYSGIKKIESLVNFSLITEKQAIDCIKSGLRDPDIWYDWILVHQVREIIDRWKSWLAERDRNIFDESHVRSVRGRDHESM